MSRKRAARLGEARERLRQAGRTAEAPREVLASLAPRWGEQPELERAAIALAAESDEHGIGDSLAELLERTSDRERRREIKRALFRLEQRGLWRPPEAPPPPSTAALLGPPESGREAWLSPFDASGVRVLWLARRAPDGVVTITAIASEESGLLEFHAGRTTRKALRRMQADLAAQTGLRLVEAPWPHVCWLVREAWERAADRDRLGDVPGALRAIAPQLPAEPPPPPVDALLDRAAVASDLAALTSSAQALEEPELASWILPRNWVEAAAETLAKEPPSLVVLPPAQEQERKRQALARAAREMIDEPERRDRLARRLEDTAYLLARKGTLEPARRALAAAIALRDGRAIGEIPLATALAERSLALLLSAREEGAREAARSSLVVTPAQALAEARRRGPGRG